MATRKANFVQRLISHSWFFYVARPLIKRLHLDLAYFAKGSFYSLIQQIIGVSCGLTVSYLFGHYVSKQVFGEYNLILSIVSLITFLSLPGIDNALTRSIGQGFDGSFKQALVSKIKFSLLGSVALVGIALYYLAHFQKKRFFWSHIDRRILSFALFSDVIHTIPSRKKIIYAAFKHKQLVLCIISCR